MVEFATAGVVSTLLIISTFKLAMIMWTYHTLAYGIHDMTRYSAVRGYGCTRPGNTCSVTLGTLATRIQTMGIGVRSDVVSVTFATDSGAATTCNPLNTCTSSTTVWPPSSNSDNRVGKKITIAASYQFASALIF